MMKAGKIYCVISNVVLLFFLFCGCGGNVGEEKTQGDLGGECYPNGTCDSPYVCEEGICNKPEEGVGGLGEECYPNQTCDNPYVCKDGVCGDGEENRGGLGEPCYLDNSCDEPFICEEGICVEENTNPPLDIFEVHFNEPIDDGTDEHLEDVIIELLDMAVPGSVVRAAFYTWSRTRIADAFVDAFENGVDVRVVLGNTNVHTDGTDWQAVRILKEGLGERLTICREGEASGGCIGDGIQHNKFTVFSELNDGSTNVVFQSSANHTNPQRYQFNNAVIIREDDSLYEAYTNYWYDLRAQQPDLDYYRSFLGDQNTKVYFFPRASGDTIVNVLNNVVCDENSRIHVAMAYFSNPRTAVAEALAARRSEGCEVSVLVREDTTGSQIISTLSVGGIDLGVFPTDAVHSVHSKYLLIDSPYASSTEPLKLVWTGSHNYTGPSLRNHDETLLKIEDPDVYEAYLANWEMMRDRI